jgi:RecA-family ATPase
MEKQLKQINKDNENIGLFTLRTGNKTIENAMKKDIPKMLISELWFEGELCILFADTNIGKSIFAVQIGDSISKGIAINGFKLEAKKQTILYLDFELSDKQFENRYSTEYQNHYKWNDNFIRVDINPDANIPEGESFEDYLVHSIEKSIIKTGSKILIIDNLTYLSAETEKATYALPLMKQLKALKSKYGLSILALAHTPKRDNAKPINKNDLQGSKMLINFCDSSFAIGESIKDKNLRYLKQIKQRNTDHLYDSENVILCEINKPNSFLQFEFIGFGSEYEHLKQLTDNDKEVFKQKVIALHKQGRSLRDIAKELGTYAMRVSRVIDEV